MAGLGSQELLIIGMVLFLISPVIFALAIIFIMKRRGPKQPD